MKGKSFRYSIRVDPLLPFFSFALCPKLDSISNGPMVNRKLLLSITNRERLFSGGESYTITDFLQRSRESLQIASDRVKAKYGFPCGLAMGQLQKIEDTAEQFLEQPDGKVTVLQFQ